MTNSTKTSMSGFFEMGRHIKNNLNFSGLQDTPTGYDEGKFLRSTDNGLEYVDISGQVPVSFLDDIIDKPTAEVLGGYLKLDNVGKLVWSPATTDGDIAYTITGATHITGLLDTPDGYDEGKFLRSTSNGVEYVDISGQVPVTFEEIIGTPDQYQSGKYLVSTETGIEYRDIDSAASSFIELSDTPRDYDDGKYLASTANGLEWVDATTTEGGDDTSVVPEVYDNINSLPLAINQDGAIVRVGCNLYVSCDGQWKPLVESGQEQLPVSTIPGCIKNINELTLYQAYKDEFIAENVLDSFAAGFDQTFQSLIYDVCLYTEDPANIVKIDETTYKWGIFKDTTEVNISATPQQVSDGSVSFVRWDGVGAVFGDPLDPNTTLTVDKDLAITAYFARLYSAGRCSDVLLFIDAAQNIKDLSSKNSEIISEGAVDRDSDGLHFGRGGNFTRYSSSEYTRATIPSSLFGNSKTFTFQFRLAQTSSDAYVLSIGNKDHTVALRIYSGKLTMQIGDPGTWGTHIGTGIVPVLGKWYDITMRYGSRYNQIAISIDGVEFDWASKADSTGSSGGLSTISAIDATSYLSINSPFTGASGVNADYKNIKIFEDQATNISTIDPTSTLVPAGCTSLLFSSLNGSGNDDENLTFAPVVPHSRIMAEMDSGKSAVFNGSNSYIDTQLNLHDLTNLSLSFWLYWDSSVSGSVIGSTNNSGAIRACSQQIQLRSSDNRFDYTSRQGDLVRHTISLPEGWHHFAVTDNNSTTPSDAVNMYVDGIPVSYSVLVNNGGYSTNTNMQIGRTRQSDNAIGRYLNTELDDLRIYSDILTPTEIQYISRNDRPHIPTDNLTAYYKFDDNVNDQSELYDGTPHSITYTESANFSLTDHLLLTDKPFASLGTEAYTIEFSVKMDTFQGDLIFSSSWERAIQEAGECTGSGQYWYLRVDTNGFVHFDFRDGGNTHASSIAINLGVWNHVAITYDGSIGVGESGKSTGYTFWINGVKAGEWGSYIQRSHSDGCIGQINGVIDMGGHGLSLTQYETIGYSPGSSYAGFLGSLKEIRIIKGKSIYSADFTPPTVIQNLCE